MWGKAPRPYPLTLKGGAHRERSEAERQTAHPSQYVEQSSLRELFGAAAKGAGRAILLSWEITDFPTHREPQAVCRGVAALSLTVRCRLRLGSY